MKKLFLLFSILLLIISLHAQQTKNIQEKEIVERITRLEEGLKRLEQGQKNILREMDKRFEAVDKRFEAVDKRFEAVDKRFEALDKRFDAMDKRFDQLINVFIGIVAAFAGIVAVTIGFAIWDRRTALRPVMIISQELEEREKRVEKALKLWAEKSPELKEILKRVGLI